MANEKTPTTKLTFAVDHTTRDGESYKQGETKDVDFLTARNLLANGIAAEATSKSTPAASAAK